LAAAPLNILVTSLSRKVPLLQALAAAPGAGRVWGADSDPECVGRWFADGFWEMPPLAQDGTRERLLAFVEAERIGLLVPTRDGELPFFAELRDELTARGVHTPIGTPDAVDSCLDKLRFHDHCASAGIPVVPTASEPDAGFGDRLVVKERRGAGGAGVGLDLAPKAAREHAAGLLEPVFQPFVDGDEHSIDVYVNREGRVVDAAPRRRIRVHEGESTVTETVEHSSLAGAAIALAESLPLRGHLVVQGFALGDEALLVECNPRVGGASTLAFHAGVDSPAWFVREAAGEVVEPRLGSYRRGLRLVRYSADRLIEA